MRLLYEASKREGILPSRIIQARDFRDYGELKKYLLQRRYPQAIAGGKNIRAYLPKLELKAPECVKLKEEKFYPEDIFIEEKVKHSFLSCRFKEIFPKARLHNIESLKGYHRQNRAFDISDYNQRRKKVFITAENYDFFKKCPCTKGASGCNYHIFNLGFGCIYECSYCFLQEYANTPEIILPANLDDFFAKFAAYKKIPMRIGTGEFCDSLALDEFTRYSIPLVEFFREQKGVRFEFKTKSAQVQNLLELKHGGNIVVSWSLNPPGIIRQNEFYSATLAERLKAAGQCAGAGYKIGFHFDPIIYFDGWQREYSDTIEHLFSAVRPKDIAWISLGTLRFNPALKPIIEKRFPQNRILDGELILGYDYKLRYPSFLRHTIYRFMRSTLSKYSRKLKIYLCMEDSPTRNVL